MFGKAARFHEPHPSETPGPNAYDPKEPQATYRRGAMFESDARFKETRREEEAVAAQCESTSKRRTTLGESMHANTTLHALPSIASSAKGKDKDRSSRLEERLRKLEGQIERLQYEKAAAENEREDGLVKLRLAQQGEAKAKQALEKAKKTPSNLHTRLEQLEQQHLHALAAAEQQARDAAKAAEKAEERAAASQKRLGDVRKAIVGAEREADLQRLRAEKAEKRAVDDQQLERQREQSEELRLLVDAQAEEVQASQHNLRMIANVVGREFGEAEELISTLRLHASTARQQARQWEGAFRQTRRRATSLDEQVSQLTDQLAAERAAAIEAQEDVARLIRSRELEHALFEPFEEGLVGSQCCAHDEHRTLLNIKDQQIALEVAEMRLSLVRDNDSRHACDIDALNDDFVGALTQLSHTMDLRAQDEAQARNLRDRVAHLDRLLQEAETRAQDVDKQQMHMRQENETLRKTMVEGKKALDKANGLFEGMQRSYATDVSNVKARNTAMQDEIERLNDELRNLRDIEEAYALLSSDLELERARSSEAQTEAELLSVANTELASHQNPAQRLMYLDRIRVDLSDTREELRRERVGAQALQAEVGALKEELNRYKSVDGEGRRVVGRFTRVKRDRSLLASLGVGVDVSSSIAMGRPPSASVRKPAFRISSGGTAASRHNATSAAATSGKCVPRPPPVHNAARPRRSKRRSSASMIAEAGPSLLGRGPPVTRDAEWKDEGEMTLDELTRR